MYYSIETTMGSRNCEKNVNSVLTYKTIGCIMMFPKARESTRYCVGGEPNNCDTKFTMGGLGAMPITSIKKRD